MKPEILAQLVFDWERYLSENRDEYGGHYWNDLYLEWFQFKKDYEEGAGG